ncbi:MAG: phosphoesterase [Gemmatimonadetes bacterium]|nr:phosphoesterase [Gemmatimonadota bacterium]
MRTRYGLFLLAILAGCRTAAPGGVRESDQIATQAPLLSTGVSLDPEGRTVPVGQFPLAMIRAPGGRQVVLLLNGYQDQGIQVLDAATGAVLQTELQPAAFLGVAFSPDGKTLYASGGNEDVVFRYMWREGRATLQDRLVLAVKVPDKSGTRYPGGLAPSPDGRFLYVAENLADSLAVIDVASGRVTQRLPAGRYPYGVVVAADGTVYVSAWGGDAVRAYRPDPAGGLMPATTIPVARHPSAMLLNADGSRLFVTSGSTDRVSVVDTRRGRLITDLLDPAPVGPSEGSTPNALALSTDGTRLFVAEADNNAVAVFDLSARSSGVPAAAGDDRLVGRIPAEAYPTAVLASGDTLLVVSGKGRGSKPNRDTGPRGPGKCRYTGPTGPAGGACQQLGPGAHDALVSAVRARHLHHQGEPDLRPGSRRFAPG